MQHLIVTYGYLAVFVLMVAESACIPVPSELIMTFAGALAAGAVPGTSLNLVAVIAAGVAGNVVGSYLAWAAGRYGGQPALQRWGHRLWLREHDLDRANSWFARYVPGGPDRPRPAGGAHLHLTSRGHRGDGPGAVRHLHDHWLHSVDRRAGLRGLCRRRQLAVHRQWLPRSHLRHRRRSGDRPGHCHLALRPPAQGGERGCWRPAPSGGRRIRGGGQPDASGERPDAAGRQPDIRTRR